MNEQNIQERISALVEQEQALRGSNAEDHQGELKRVETELDQCWDLLRQRRAKQDAGEDPSEAEPRPVDEVEGYLQ